MRIKSSLASVVVVLALPVGACVQQQATDPVIAVDTNEVSSVPEKEVKLGPAIATVKPGASVTFSHEAPDKLQIGDNGVVILTVNEGYPVGTLHLQASADAGLAVFGAEASTTKDMAAGTSHSWRVDFAAEADGVHYINVLARVEVEDGFQESRAYAVRVEVGDWQAAQAKAQATGGVEIQADGEPAVILQAEETIE